MRSLLFASCVVAVATAAGTDYPTLFTDFKAKYGRTYATKAEEAKRFGYFVDNMKIADAYTKMNPMATFGVNPFADYSAAEFKTYHSGNAYFEATSKARGAEVSMSAEEKKVAAGAQIDWRTKGAVTHVKNQGQCGSCWSFSTTGGIEGQWFLAGNTLTSLSEQELVSCDTIDQGCQGGLMKNAYKWLLENKGGKIVTAASYPYESGGGYVPSCDLSGKVFGAQITGHVDVAKDETTMAAWVYKHGPLSIGVDATSWQMYQGGIMSNCEPGQMDHGVLIVGFDDTGYTPYWIIKNSWGPSWGESGYLRVAKGSDQCSLTQYPCSSTVAGGSNPTSPPVTNTPGAGPAPPPPPPGPPADCAQYMTCDDCTIYTSATTCGWCDNKCQSGTSAGPTSGTCGGSAWHWEGAHCPGNTPPSPPPAPGPTATWPPPAPVTPNPWYYPTPNPTSPPTAPPAPKYNLKQTQCTDGTCLHGCQSTLLPTGTCKPFNSGSGWLKSAIATCNVAAGNAVLKAWDNSDCSGSVTETQTITLNNCYGPQANNGSYSDQCVPVTEANLMGIKEGRGFVGLKAPRQSHKLKKF